MNKYLKYLIDIKVKCCNCNLMLELRNNDELLSLLCLNCIYENDSDNNYVEIFEPSYYYLNNANKNISVFNNKVCFFETDMLQEIKLENLTLPIIIDNDKICFDEMYNRLCKISILN